MKKVFAILLVLAVVAGFVFAETAPTTGANEAHVITVQSDVACVVPGFSFSYSNAVTNNSVSSEDGSKAAAFGTGPTDLTVSTAQNLGQNIADQDVSAVFTIKSNRVCNYKGSFTLSVAATPFKTSTLTTSATQKSVTYTADTGDHSSDYITIANYVASGTAAETDPLKVTYNGKQSSSSVTLGTVAVVWNQATEAVPDSYKSDVTLTVTAL